MLRLHKRKTAGGGSEATVTQPEFLHFCLLDRQELGLEDKIPSFMCTRNVSSSDMVSSSSCSHLFELPFDCEAPQNLLSCLLSLDFEELLLSVYFYIILIFAFLVLSSERSERSAPIEIPGNERSFSQTETTKKTIDNYATEEN